MTSMLLSDALDPSERERHGASAATNLPAGQNVLVCKGSRQSLSSHFVIRRQLKFKNCHWQVPNRFPLSCVLILSPFLFSLVLFVCRCLLDTCCLVDASHTPVNEPYGASGGKLLFWWNLLYGKSSPTSLSVVHSVLRTR